MRNGFILVDTTSLGEILAFAYARGRNRVPKSFPAKLGIIQRNLTMLRNPGKHWKDFLKIDKLSNSSKTFGFSIKTDGTLWKRFEEVHLGSLEKDEKWIHFS
ncbi:hypothetical protein MP638_003928 [Amoeboaphelidium occidentale]|nr:hypothetical protein MP638_003928 [Amoeboaphelidium occidentale]